MVRDKRGIEANLDKIMNFVIITMQNSRNCGELLRVDVCLLSRSVHPHLFSHH